MRQKSKSGFGILEAILTIVLLGLVFATIPMLLSQATKSDEVVLEGEALYHAAALIGRIAAMPFNSVALDGNESRVIDFDGLQCADQNISNAPARLGTKALIPEGVGANRFRSCTVPLSHAQRTLYDTLEDDNPDEPGNRRAVNHFQGYERIFDNRGFKLVVRLSWLGDPDDWSGWPTSPDPTNLVLIEVTAQHDGKNNDEVIGTLRYVAANIGSLEAPIQQVAP